MNLLSYLKKAKKTPVSLREWLPVISEADLFRIAPPRLFAWYLVKDVPIELLDPENLGIDWSDPENTERYERIARAIRRGAPLWPVIVSEYGTMVDGYHRLAFIWENRLSRFIDVLYFVRKT